MITRKFLVVDDDREDTELFTEAVKSVDESVSCLSAVHGKDALDKLDHESKARPDIIFLDINMPIMNGWQFLNEIKDDDELSDIPVIMYSSSTHRSDMKNALSAGALCFFTKPDDFERLRKILQIVVEHMSNGILDKVCEAIRRA